MRFVRTIPTDASLSIDTDNGPTQSTVLPPEPDVLQVDCGCKVGCAVLHPRLLIMREDRLCLSLCSFARRRVIFGLSNHSIRF